VKRETFNMPLRVKEVFICVSATSDRLASDFFFLSMALSFRQPVFRDIMKKETKKILIVLFLAFTMFFSSAAWIILGAAPMSAQQSTPPFPESMVVEGRLNESIAAALLQRGYSIMEWHYYEGCCPDLMLFVEGLPAEVENQLVVQKIADSNLTWASARSLRGEQSWNVTDFSDLLEPLCGVLLKPPVECGLMQFGTAASNETENVTAAAS